MAAALAHHYAGDGLHIRTGGSSPGGQLHPEVAHAIKQIGLSLDEEFPKSLTDEVVAAADVVVTMGCGDECPYLPARRYEDWPIARSRWALRTGRNGDTQRRRQPRPRTAHQLAPRPRAARPDPSLSLETSLMHLVAIGGSDAGISAALRARELDPSSEVTVVVADAFPNFSICGIPTTCLAKSATGRTWHTAPTPTSKQRT